MKNEFIGIRSTLYKECLKEYPNARADDIEVMKKYLNPKKEEKILEVGAGNGFFSGVIADMIGKEGTLIVSDPSSEQLEDVKELMKDNVKLVQQGAANLIFRRIQQTPFGLSEQCIMFLKKKNHSETSKKSLGKEEELPSATFFPAQNWRNILTSRLPNIAPPDTRLLFGAENMQKAFVFWPDWKNQNFTSSIKNGDLKRKKIWEFFYTKFMQ